jgi:hypothetical protein
VLPVCVLPSCHRHEDLVKFGVAVIIARREHDIVPLAEYRFGREIWGHISEIKR